LVAVEHDTPLSFFLRPFFIWFSRSRWISRASSRLPVSSGRSAAATLFGRSVQRESTDCCLLLPSLWS
jgi:hypothetical protein